MILFPSMPQQIEYIIVIFIFIIFYIYIIKQDIHIHVPYSRPNSWTDLAEIFCGHSRVLQAKKLDFFFHGQRQALQLVVFNMFQVNRDFRELKICQDIKIQTSTGRFIINLGYKPVQVDL